MALRLNSNGTPANDGFYADDKNRMRGDGERPLGVTAAEPWGVSRFSHVTSLMAHA